ncbi:FtsX-like permease family protein [Streptomyces heilongjiangensis]|nr:FtsX-like permease family protein [Streptomyces heilongjiangensis]MDC2951437.1 FtsX-like permease family protein [Streptomyces heilongjiangensis]
MAHIAVRMVRHRIAALVAVACAALGAAALLTVIGVLLDSGIRAHAPVTRLSGADIVVTAPQVYRPGGDLPVVLPERARVPGDVAVRLARLPGVRSAVGDVSFPAVVVGARGGIVPAAPDPRTAGHRWSSASLLTGTRLAGRAPSGPREIVLDARTAARAGVAPGGTVRVIAAGRPATYRVTGVVTGTAEGQGGIWFADAQAPQPAGGPRTADARHTGNADGTRPAPASPSSAVDLVAVRAAPGAADRAADEVRRELRGTGLTVATGTARGDAEDPGATAARSTLPALASSLAGVTILIVGFIVAGALTVAMAAQRRELALLRAVGAPPRQVRRLGAAQALVVAALATAPGLALGYPLAGGFRSLLVSIGLLPSALPLVYGPLPALAAVLLLAVVWCAALGATWRLSRMPATEAVAESRAEPRAPAPWRAFAGLLLIVGAVCLSVTPLLARSEAGAASTALAGIVATIGLGVAGPTLVQHAGRILLRNLPRRVTAPAWLAAANTHGYPLRVAGAVTTLAMTVVFTLTYAFTQTTLMRATTDAAQAATRADLTLAAPALGGVPAALPGQVKAVPGVTAAAPVSSTTVIMRNQMFGGESEAEAGTALVLGPDATGVLDPQVRSGDLHALTGATVAVAAGSMAQDTASVGRTLTLILGDGATVRARVVASYERGLGLGALIVSRDLVAGHTTTDLAQRLLVRTDGNPETARRVTALAERQPGVTVSRSGAPDKADHGIPPELWINVAVLAVLLGYMLLGIANKLIAGTTQRRDELAGLQLIGATARQIRAMMRREAAVICGIALTSGTLLALPPLLFLSLGFLQRPWPAGPVWLLPAVAAVVVLLTFTAVEVPTRQALRVSPAQALGRR